MVPSSSTAFTLLTSGDVVLPSTTAVRNPALTYAASSTPGGTRFSRRSIRKASSPAGGFSRSFTWRVRGPATGRVSVRVCVLASVRACVRARVCVRVCGDRSRTSWIPATCPLGIGGGIRRAVSLRGGPPARRTPLGSAAAGRSSAPCARPPVAPRGRSVGARAARCGRRGCAGREWEGRSMCLRTRAGLGETAPWHRRPS